MEEESEVSARMRQAREWLQAQGYHGQSMRRPPAHIMLSRAELPDLSESSVAAAAALLGYIVVWAPDQE